MQDQYHHYIPRFLLRNLAIDKYERIFESRENNESNIKQQKRKGAKQKKKKKKNIVNEKELLQTYDRTSNQLSVSPIARTYGYKNMYKDLNHKDVMHVEDKLSKLEGQASQVTQKIITASQEKSQVVLLRSELNDLRKFLYIMSYRNGSRWDQFTNELFDLPTGPMIASFMQQYNLQSPQEVWLQDIREMLDTPYEEIKDNERIFKIDRDDFGSRVDDYFLVIWQAGENDEFLITSNGFGIFEGVNGMIFFQPFQFAYHFLYVISPKLVLVLCRLPFREETGTEGLFKYWGTRSILENAPHPAAIPRYVGRVNTSRRGLSNGLSRREIDIALNNQGIERRLRDEFTFPFVKITSDTICTVNSIFLNEARSNLVLTFLSLPYLYKTIIKYYRDKSVRIIVQDFSDLKRVLFKALNQTHEEDLHLRRNIPVNSTCTWHVRVMNS